MGCANSKFRRYKNDSASPKRRSVTLLPKYHLDAEQGGPESQHVCHRTSISLAFSLHENSFVQSRPQGMNGNAQDNCEQLDHEEPGFEDNNKRKDQFAVRLNEAKMWLSSMDERVPKIVPKTPIRTPPGEPEKINLWELMEGLENTSPLMKPVDHCTSFSFGVAGDPEPVYVSLPIHRSQSNGMGWPENRSSCPEPENGRCSPKPKWLEMNSAEETSVPDFDPEIISMFRKSLEDLSPDDPLYVRPKALVTTSEGGDEQWEDLESKTRTREHYGFQKSKKDRVVVYFTSLRGIRKTYEDCCHVRVILKGLGVRVDEKDLSMHSGFKEELNKLLGVTYGLPRVFIGKKYIGGSDETRRLHEDGELQKLVQGCEMVDSSDSGGNTVCDACGDIRFIPCETCSGSCKIFHDCEEDEKRAEDGYGFHRCPDCNENGLIRCPLCCH